VDSATSGPCCAVIRISNCPVSGESCTILGIEPSAWGLAKARGWRVTSFPSRSYRAPQSPEALPGWWRESQESARTTGRPTRKNPPRNRRERIRLNMRSSPGADSSFPCPQPGQGLALRDWTGWAAEAASRSPADIPSDAPLGVAASPYLPWISPRPGLIGGVTRPRIPVRVPGLGSSARSARASCTRGAHRNG
jgi:hypothetical protein